MFITSASPSPSGHLNPEDIKSYLKNRLVYLAPVLMVVIPALIQVIPNDWKWGAIVVWVLGSILKLIQVIQDSK